MIADRQTRGVGIAIAGAATVAVATMFAPVALIEAIAKLSGLSEIFAAGRPPLSDIARAIIAFGAGAVTLALLTFLLLRGKSPQSATQLVVDDVDEDPAFGDRLAKLRPAILSLDEADDRTIEPADLPKLKNGDAHPDAPPRRPLSAHDLPTLELEQDAVEHVEGMEVMAIDQMMPQADMRAEKGEAEELPPATEEVPAPADVSPAPAPVPPTAPEDIQPTLEEMVAQLEAAVAERTRQLAELEVVAAQLGAGQVVGRPVAVDAGASEPAMQPPRRQRPPLEVVPTATVADDDIDSALAAALATLHRMNSGSR